MCVSELSLGSVHEERQSSVASRESDPSKTHAGKYCCNQELFKHAVVLLDLLCPVTNPFFTDGDQVQMTVKKGFNGLGHYLICMCCISRFTDVFEALGGSGTHFAL